MIWYCKWEASKWNKGMTAIKKKGFSMACLQQKRKNGSFSIVNQNGKGLDLAVRPVFDSFLFFMACMKSLSLHWQKPFY